MKVIRDLFVFFLLTVYESKRNSNWEGRSKTVTVAGDMILYIENSKDTTRKLELTSRFSKVAGYKINILKSVAFLYTNSEPLEREIKETIPFTTPSKRIKYLEINLRR